MLRSDWLLRSALVLFTDKHNKRMLTSKTDDTEDNTVHSKTCYCRQKTNTHLTETAFNHLSSTKLPSNVTTITLLQHTSDLQETTSSQDIETTLHHSSSQNTGTLPNSANISGPLETGMLTTLFHGVLFHLVHPTTARVKDVVSVLLKNF